MLGRVLGEVLARNRVLGEVLGKVLPLVSLLETRRTRPGLRCMGLGLPLQGGFALGAAPFATLRAQNAEKVRKERRQGHSGPRGGGGAKIGSYPTYLSFEISFRERLR